MWHRTWSTSCMLAIHLFSLECWQATGQKTQRVFWHIFPSNFSITIPLINITIRMLPVQFLLFPISPTSCRLRPALDKVKEFTQSLSTEKSWRSHRQSPRAKWRHRQTTTAWQEHVTKTMTGKQTASTASGGTIRSIRGQSGYRRGLDYLSSIQVKAGS